MRSLQTIQTWLATGLYLEVLCHSQIAHRLHAQCSCVYGHKVPQAQADSHDIQGGQVTSCLGLRGRAIRGAVPRRTWNACDRRTKLDRASVCCGMPLTWNTIFSATHSARPVKCSKVVCSQAWYRGAELGCVEMQDAIKQRSPLTKHSKFKWVAAKLNTSSVRRLMSLGRCCKKWKDTFSIGWWHLVAVQADACAHGDGLPLYRGSSEPGPLLKAALFLRPLGLLAPGKMSGESQKAGRRERYLVPLCGPQVGVLKLGPLRKASH